MWEDDDDEKALEKCNVISSIADSFALADTYPIRMRDAGLDHMYRTVSLHAPSFQNGKRVEFFTEPRRENEVDHLCTAMGMHHEDAGITSYLMQSKIHTKTLSDVLEYKRVDPGTISGLADRFKSIHGMNDDDDY